MKRLRVRVVRTAWGSTTRAPIGGLRPTARSLFEWAGHVHSRSALAVMLIGMPRVALGAGEAVGWSG